MEENKNAPLGAEEREIKPTSSFLSKLENFWYHYKWHSLIALFLVITITICSVQMCSKDEYDCYIMYAGDTAIPHTSSGVSQYTTTFTSLNRVAEDFDENGEVLVSFSDLYVWTADQMSAYESENRDDPTAPDLNYSLISQDTDTLSDRMIHSEYYLCFLSREVYELYKNKEGLTFFVPLTPYITEGNTYEYTNGDCDGILLGSVEGFYKSAGICELPADTVICLRAKNEVFSGFDKQAHENYYKGAEATLKNILAFD